MKLPIRSPRLKFVPEAMLLSKYLTALTALFLFAFCSIAESAVIYADNLTNKITGGGTTGTVTGSGAASVITLGSARNQAVSWDFASIALTNTNDYLTANFDFYLSAATTDGTCGVQFRLMNSTTGYTTFVTFQVNNPILNNTTPGTTLTANEGKFTSAALSTNSGSPSSFSFTLTKTATATELSMTFAGSLLNSSPQVRDVSTIPTSTTFDRIAFNFSGGSNVVGVDWRTPITTTVNNFSISTNVVPEPSTFVLIGLGVGLLLWRGRRIAASR